MIEKPDLHDEKIIACLQDEFGLHVDQIAFLPLGADLNTAVYRVIADDESPYFVKLRRGIFDEIAVTLPKFLSDQGVVQIIAPLTTRTGQLWASLDIFKLILYPFIESHNGYEIDFSDHQWGEFGTALKSIHTTVLPPALIRRIQQETYSPQWREIVKMFLERVEDDTIDEPVAVKLAAFVKAKRDEILNLLGRAEHLAQAIQAQFHEFVLCHSDIHAGNILIDANDAFYIVDWDNPILAPKERDLMFIGGGQMGTWHTPQEEETLFYRGYGQTQINPVALAYYRYERIIQD
ncbi:MAG: phosphotransferase, partial [Chloroflexi bacterium RBG_16_48_8]